MRKPSGLVFVVALCAISASAHAQQHIIRDSEAASYVGKFVTVEGTVANVHVTKGGTTFLNFGSSYPDQTFTAVIFRSSKSLFANVQEWQGKRVRVTGQIRLYRGSPEIILTEVNQLAAIP